MADNFLRYIFNTITDALGFEYIMTSQTKGSINVGFLAVAIPETSSFAVPGLTAGFDAFRRRRP